MSEQVVVSVIPPCDFCKEGHSGEQVPAAVDGRTASGMWAYMCEAHFTLHGVGLGTGKGQRLVLTDPNMCECGLGKATQADLDAGYTHCMFCVEMGDEENHSVHDVLWDRWKDAENSAF